MKTKKRISLVLGSGGARGLAHIGIIRRLEELGYEIVSISGCSIGALVGGFYAAGKLHEYEAWVRTLDALDIIKLLDFDGDGGLLSGKKLMKKLYSFVGNVKIETLGIKFTAIASDIEDEKEVWINSGELLDAIRASISIPMFFAPFRLNGSTLVDGGVLNPVPIAPTFGDDTEMTLAVNLGAKLSHQNLLGEPTLKEKSIANSIKEYLSKISLKNTLLEKSMFGVANSSFDTMQANLSRMKLAAYPPDMLIDIPRDLCGMLEFNRANEIIEYGYQKAKEVVG